MRYPNAMRGYACRFFFLLFLIGPQMADGQTQTPTKQILDLKVDSFKTGLQEISNSFWVDDNQFVMTTLQEGTDGEYVKADTPSRIALINFKNKTIKYIAQDARLLDFTFDRKTRSIFIGALRPKEATEPGKPYIGPYTLENLREIRIEPDGQVIEVKKYPPGSKPRGPEMEPPKDKSFKSLDNGRGGYLVRDLKPGDTYMKQWERQVRDDEPLPTLWVQQGKPDMPLPIRFDEIGSGEYVAFLDKYQLSDYDTAVSSTTSSRIAVTIWKRPYEYTPFRLLAQDGSIQEIPYPEFVFEYGLAERGKRGANFGRFLVTKPGVVIQKKREYGSALYLFRNDQLYLVAGGKTALHIDLAENSAEEVKTTRLSPDGCKLAYSHLKGLAAMSRYGAPHFFSIINLCTDNK